MADCGSCECGLLLLMYGRNKNGSEKRNIHTDKCSMIATHFFWYQAELIGAS